MIKVFRVYYTKPATADKIFTKDISSMEGYEKMVY